ncbi:MAG: PEP-CTERM sorting domain-containing protein [Opitutales bacterium]
MRKAALALSACALATSGHALLIDDFDDAFGVGPITESSTTSTGLSIDDPAPAPIPFDVRAAEVDGPADVLGFGESTLEIFPDASVLSFSNNSDVVDSFFVLEYFQDGSAPVDLTDGGSSSAFIIDLVLSDIDSPDEGLLIIDVVSDSGPMSGAAAMVSFSEPGSIVVPFAAFDPSISFDDIVLLEFMFIFDDTGAADIAIDSIATGVPEPSTYAAVFGLLFFALTVVRRLRRS